MSTDLDVKPADDAAPPPSDGDDKLDKRVLMMAGVVVLGAIMSILDITVVSVALRTFQNIFDASPAQVALAWLMAQKPWIVPLFGTRKVERLDENLGALSVTLTAGDLDEIETVASTIEIEGARYPEEILRRSGL